ncbi:MAG TPA: cupin domain-containing protein [Pedobacter sp.]|nr:cupin domain-containing protein [Pedobacter sp.]
MNTTLTNAVPVIAGTYRDYHGGYFKILVSPEETNGAMAMIDMVLPKGVEPPLHVHQNEDETFYVLEGKMTFGVGERQVELGPEDALFCPRGVPHVFRIDSAQARFITLITPGEMVNYFMDFSTPTVGDPVVKPPLGPPPADVIELLLTTLKEKYSITLM